MVDSPNRPTQLILGGLCTYVALYFLLMSRTVSLDANGNLAFMSTFRLAPSIRSNGTNTIFCGRACFLNYAFYPLDWVYWNIADPARWKKFKELKQALPEETIYFDKRNSGAATGDGKSNPQK